jgi:hypothetical protein
LVRTTSKIFMCRSWNASSRTTTSSMTTPVTAHEKGSRWYGCGSCQCRAKQRCVAGASTLAPPHCWLAVRCLSPISVASATARKRAPWYGALCSDVRCLRQWHRLFHSGRAAGKSHRRSGNTLEHAAWTRWPNNKIAGQDASSRCVCWLVGPDRDTFSMWTPTDTDQNGPFALQVCVGPLEMPLLTVHPSGVFFQTACVVLCYPVL